MTDNMPDFDSMSPEELMAWMETLAKRQGADEGFTTNADMQIAEIDPAAAPDTGPGYIPYGMTEDQWKKKQEDEATRKAARAAQTTAPAAPVQPAPPPVQAQPEPTPAPAAPQQPAASTASNDQPDFDSMSPEELMRWMESLAKRQGASEGLTTNADMQIAEVDPSLVHIDEPGYIPYGMDTETWTQKQAEEAARKAAAMPPAAAARPAAPTPAPQPEAAQAQPSLELPTFDETPTEETTQAMPVVSDGLAWLESLTADANQTEFPQLDLSALGEPLAMNDPLPAQTEDPMAWLESLAQTQGDIPGLEAFSLDNLGLDTPAAETAADSLNATEDPMAWLESLAKRQGVDSEELMTDANLDIPLSPASPAPRNYTDYTFETATNETNSLDFLDLDGDGDFQTDSDEVDDPAAWLEALASGQSYDFDANTAQTEAPAEEADVDIMEALASGANIPADEMKNWMDNLLAEGASRDDVADYIEEEDDTPVQAELPAWLIEQVGAPPPTLTTNEESAPALLDEIIEPPAVEMPDWLAEDIQEEEELSFDSIFDTAEEEPAIPAVSVPEPGLSTNQKSVTSELQLDPDDPWVEAFELERKQRLGQVDELPTWALEDDASALTATPEPAVALAAANLPQETELSAGQLQPVPSWMDVTEAALAVDDTEFAPLPDNLFEEAAAEPGEMPDWLRSQVTVDAAVTDDDELPDWLREAGVDEAADVPDWLVETLGTDEQAIIEPQTIAPQIITPPSAQPAPAAIVPAAQTPPAPTTINVAGVLETARQQLQGGDLDSSLNSYETIIRANTQIEIVVSDLSEIARQERYKQNPTVYRILGDGLMRQGRLQEALDTYRKALNML